MKLNKNTLKTLIFTGAMTYFGTHLNQVQAQDYAQTSSNNNPDYYLMNKDKMSPGPQVIRSVQYDDFNNDNTIDQLILTETPSQNDLNIYFF